MPCQVPLVKKVKTVKDGKYYAKRRIGKGLTTKSYAHKELNGKVDAVGGKVDAVGKKVDDVGGKVDAVQQGQTLLPGRVADELIKRGLVVSPAPASAPPFA